MEPTAINAPLKGRHAAMPFLTLGIAAVVLGGMFSAVTARSATYHSAWFVAYLVLVVGVAQVGLGLGQWWLSSKPLPVGVLMAELVIFNFGNAGVILGSVLEASLWVDVGSALVVISLGIFGWAVWPARRQGVVLWMYWALVVLLMASVIVGLFFAHAASR